jgi:hypothetical protein
MAAVPGEFTALPARLTITVTIKRDQGTSVIQKCPGQVRAA